MTATATGTAVEHAVLDRTWSSRPGIVGWLTAVNHKQIGLRFVVTAFGFMLVGGVLAGLIRLQLIVPRAEVLGPEAYNQVFTMHGTIMMFLFAVPMLEGLGMYFVPLMIGARDLPFPRLNAFGYWLYLGGGLILMWSFVTGSVPDGGWFAYPTLTGPEFSPDRGLDFWLLGVTMLEVSGIVGALELVVVILRHRAPGMTLSRMPIFVWSILLQGGMILLAFPAIIAASLMLEIERKFGVPFYDPTGEGNPLLWQHLFWIFGHPEVYIMLIPATGVVSAVVQTFARRPLVAYPLVVAALTAIAILSFGLWVHHMFAVGIPMLALALFSVASMLIAIPSGVQVFSWLATIWTGRVRWSTPMLFVAGFIVIFVAGGITGVMVASAPFDWQVHDSFFVVAHFHYVLFGGVVFPIFAALHYWFPKWTGRVPGEALGKASFWIMFVGFNVAFFPQHFLGFLGMPRRVYTYDPGLGWEGHNLASSLGTGVLTLGILVFMVNLAVSASRGRIAGPNPWSADTLEWAAASPPPSYNFGELPVVGAREPLWAPGVDLDERTRAVTTALRAPTAPGAREQLATTVVDAQIVEVTRLAGPSIWPLLTAAAVTVAMVGVLVDAWTLAVLAGLGVVVGLVAWLAPRSPA